jgi:hypothetical protein
MRVKVEFEMAHDQTVTPENWTKFRAVIARMVDQRVGFSVKDGSIVVTPFGFFTSDGGVECYACPCGSVSAIAAMTTKRRPKFVRCPDCKKSIPTDQ